MNEQTKASTMPCKEYQAEKASTDLLDLIRISKDNVNIKIAQLAEFRMKLGIYEQCEEDACCEKSGTPERLPSFIETWNALPDDFYSMARSIRKEIDLLDDEIYKECETQGEGIDSPVPSGQIPQIECALDAFAGAVRSLNHFSNRMMVNSDCKEGSNVESVKCTPTFRDIWENLPVIFDEASETIAIATDKISQTVYMPLEDTAGNSC